MTFKNKLEELTYKLELAKWLAFAPFHLPTGPEIRAVEKAERKLAEYKSKNNI